MNVILIYPPFAKAHSPYMSIPALAAFLKSHGVEVSAFDLNNALYRYYLSPGRIADGAEFLKERLLELNSRPALRFSEMFELSRLVRMALETERFIEDLDRNQEVGGDTGHIWTHYAVKSAIRLVFAPYFPHTIDYFNDFIKYLSPWSEFCTSDILKSIQVRTFFDDVLEKHVFRQLTKKRPGIIGISVGFPDQLLPAFKVAAAAKRCLPDAHITLGGAFLSVYFRMLKEPRLFDWVDSIILDDGEIPLLRLAQEIVKPAPNLERIPGMTYLDQGVIRRNPPVSPPAMDTLPVPDYNVFPLDNYFVPRTKIMFPFRLSRGCGWGRCAFCTTRLGLIGHHDQPPREVAYERLRKMLDQTGGESVFFTDDSPDPRILGFISKRLAKDRVPLSWYTHIRANPELTLERCLQMKRAGCKSLFVGVEAYNDRLLRLMNKGITTELIDRTLSNMSWAGLPVGAYMIVGLPTETEAEALAGFERIRAMKDAGLIARYHYNVFKILPHSDISLRPGLYGIDRIIRPEALDLDSPSINFSGAGMSREQMLALGLSGLRGSGISSDRILELGILKPWETGADHLRDVALNGMVVPLRYDVNEIHSMWFERSKRRVLELLPFGKWLEQEDGSNDRLKPKFLL
ncbi:MAG: B12-binding domain-containing radical SAM protein [Deltaproteobacteria bacterium]|nr:B12-binding domain-containing radical SAM protein [Deltaproteobacteria bacterium]